MIVFYRTLINLILLISPLIILTRIIKKKEHPTRFKEKFCFFSKKKLKKRVFKKFLLTEVTHYKSTVN